MPRYVAERELLAPIDDVWRFVSEPYHLSDWWPGISGVEPDRRGLAAGARWKVQGPGFIRKQETARVLLVREVVTGQRFSFELPAIRTVVEVELRAADANRTRVTVAVEGRFLFGPGSTLGKQALARLYDLVQTGAEP